MDFGEELRTFCAMLQRTSPGVVSAMSMTVPLDDTANSSAVAVLRQAERIAGEYGLRVTAEIDTHEVTLRLSRLWDE